ncbi:MAG: HD domain-containing protein [Promethearchaeota archaeon]
MKWQFLDILERNGYSNTADCCQTLIQLPLFTHLKGISYLGSFRFVFDVKKVFTRWEHSINTAMLIAKVLIHNNFTESEAAPTIIYGLLHDIGHIFFSHIGEQALQVSRNFNHNTNTISIFNSANILKILKQHNILLNYNKIITGKNSFLVASHLDCDTLDGITTTAEILNLHIINIQDIQNLLLNYLHFEDEEWKWNEKALEIIQEFWKLKSKIYLEYVYSSQNQACEIMLERVIQLINPTNLYLSENKLLKTIPVGSTAYYLYEKILNKEFFVEYSMYEWNKFKKIKDISNWIKKIKEKLSREKLWPPNSFFIKYINEKIFRQWKISEALKYIKNCAYFNQFLDKYYTEKKRARVFIDPLLQ